MNWRTAGLIVLAGVFIRQPAAGAPFTPADDNLVLESGLPTTDPRMREIRALAREMRQRPGDVGIAMRLASRQLAMGVAEADPRFVGYAQAALGAWWRDPAPRVALRVLRARVRQAQHDFITAAVDLHAALREEPGNPEALLLLASVDEVSGSVAEAKMACAELGRLRPGLAATACAASIGSLTGDAETSYRALAQAVDTTPSRDNALQVWALTILAEIAIRLDDPAGERWLEAARTLDSRNVYVLTTLADYLLDQGRAGEVLRLLRGFERIDALYLRLTLAAEAVDDPRFAEYRENLAARFKAARRQGDTVHLRDASRFALEVEHDGPYALDLARLNWETHKTPADMRVLLAAAIACHDPTAARPIVDWMAATRLEDRTIERYLRGSTPITRLRRSPTPPPRSL
jgi:tetratricopeptide (TPR) repeat protein